MWNPKSSTKWRKSVSNCNVHYSYAWIDKYQRIIRKIVLIGAPNRIDRTRGHLVDLVELYPLACFNVYVIQFIQGVALAYDARVIIEFTDYINNRKTYACKVSKNEQIEQNSDLMP